MRMLKWNVWVRLLLLGAAVGVSSISVNSKAMAQDGELADVATAPAAPEPAAPPEPAALPEPAVLPEPNGLPLAEPVSPRLDELPVPSSSAATLAPATSGQNGLSTTGRYQDAQALFGRVAFRSPNTPRSMPIILEVTAIPDEERKALQEDLKILESLINKAIVGKNHSPDVNIALGVPLYRSEQESHLIWIQDGGLLYRRTLPGISLAPRASGNGKSEGAQDAEPESEWDAARRELMKAENAESLLTDRVFTRSGMPGYDQEYVEALKARVSAALKNVSRVRLPSSSKPAARICTVALTCPEDGSTLTFRIGDDGTVSSHQYIDENQTNYDRISSWGGPAFAPPQPPSFYNMEPAAVAPAAPADQAIRKPVPAQPALPALPSQPARRSSSRASSPDSRPADVIETRPSSGGR
ncbi:MAG: hypothetical protein JNM43_24365 [Planctomycetaceae bacterium]|nr:hypothetical protein [Planctomycetaceae bacterium]